MGAGSQASTRLLDLLREPTEQFKFVVPTDSPTPIFDAVVAELGMTWPDPGSFR